MHCCADVDQKVRTGVIGIYTLMPKSIKKCYRYVQFGAETGRNIPDMCGR